jgi:AraC-like DNA-binding protein
MVDGHFISINLCDEPLRFQTRNASGEWTSVVMQPGTFWINPEGQPFSLRVDTQARWAGALVKSRYLDSVLGRHYELHGGFGIVDEQLRHLALALIHQAEPHNRAHDREGKLASTLIRSFVLALGLHHGEQAPEKACRGGITQHQLRVLIEWIDSRLEGSIRIEDMAAKLDLSPAHFAREFKRTTGFTPWTYVMKRRVQRAAALLRRGGPICEIAAQCGFSDQAHFSRTFKQHLGLTPKEFRRAGGYAEM